MYPTFVATLCAKEFANAYPTPHHERDGWTKLNKRERAALTATFKKLLNKGVIEPGPEF